MKTVKLKDLVDFSNGYAFKSTDYVEYSNTVNCRMSNIRPDGSFDVEYNIKYLPDELAEKYKGFILNDGDIIIAMTDMAGDPKILGVPTLVNTKGYSVLMNQRVGKLTLKSKDIHPTYLKYYLMSNYARNYFKSFAGGGVQLNIGQKEILNIDIKLCDIKEQVEICNVLDKINVLIQQNSKQIEKLDQLIKSRFIELFGDPETNPKGLEKVLLSDIAEYFNGLTYSPDNVTNDGTIVLRSSNIQNSQLDFADTVRVNSSIKDKLFVKDNDILMCSRNGSARLVGKVALIKNLSEPMTFGAFMMIIRSRYYPYLMTYFQMDAFRRQIATGATTTINQITGNMLNKISLPLPNMADINEFATFVEQTNKSKLVIQESLAELETLKKALMQKYFG